MFLTSFEDLFSFLYIFIGHRVQLRIKCSFVEPCCSHIMNVLEVHFKVITVHFFKFGIYYVQKSTGIACTKMSPIFQNGINKLPAE